MLIDVCLQTKARDRPSTAPAKRRPVDYGRLAQLARPARTREKFPALFTAGGGFGSSADRFAFERMRERAQGRTPVQTYTFHTEQHD